MDLKEIKELIKIFDVSGLGELKISQERFKIKLSKSASLALTQTSQKVIESNQVLPQSTNALPSAAAQQVQTNTASESTKATKSGESVNSPMVGTFYRCPSPDAPAYVNVGDKVKKGQTLAIIEAMKIMNEIEAEFDCKIVEIVASDAQPVEYSSPLFIVERL